MWGGSARRSRPSEPRAPRDGPYPGAGPNAHGAAEQYTPRAVAAAAAAAVMHDVHHKHIETAETTTATSTTTTTTTTQYREHRPDHDQHECKLVQKSAHHHDLLLCNDLMDFFILGIHMLRGYIISQI